jgi:hypothetical protein
MQRSHQFETLKAAKEAINRHILNNGESYKVEKSDKKQYYVICKEDGCDFGIRAAKSRKEEVKITKVKPHICRPTIHYNNRQAHLVSYLIEHYCASIIDNRKITIA